MKGKEADGYFAKLGCSSSKEWSASGWGVEVFQEVILSEFMKKGWRDLVSVWMRVVGRVEATQ